LEVATEGSVEGLLAEGPLKVTAEGPLEVEVEGPLKVTAEGPLEVEAEGPLEVATEGLLEVEAEGPLEVATEDPLGVIVEGPLEVAAVCSRKLSTSDSSDGGCSSSLATAILSSSRSSWLRMASNSSVSKYEVRARPTEGS